MILPIHVYGSDVLRANAQEIDVATYEGLQELIDNMQETMERADGVGIAARAGMSRNGQNLIPLRKANIN